MKKIQIKDIVKAVSGELLWGDETVMVDSVVTDSRKAKKGTLFVPIIGERVDAHKFIGDVLDAGASVTFSQNPDIKYEKGACIYVEDTLKALQDFASWYRSQFDIPVVGITGSVGKTTTKEMIASVLEKKYKLVKTIGNLNSQIGVSLMMFEIEEDTQMAVIEMGISIPGEMDRLVNIAKPTAAVLTIVGVSHIANLGSRDGICKEKGKIISKLDESGRFFISGNGDLISLAKNNIPFVNANKNQVLYFGLSDELDYYADNMTNDGLSQSFDFHSKNSSNVHTVKLNVLGEHNVNNAVVALGLGELFGVPIDKAIEGLAEYKPIAMRGVIKDCNGAHVIDDTYNASPDSINSNIHALFDYEGGRKIAVLADVLELGEQSKKLHRSVGEFILQKINEGKKLDMVFTYGTDAKEIYTCVKEGSDIEVQHFDDKKALIDALKLALKKDDWVLVKGSRGMAMDEVVEKLTKE